IPLSGTRIPCHILGTMSIRSKRALIALGGATIFVAALALIAVFAFDADRYRAKLVSYLQEATGHPVEISHLALSLSPFTLRIENCGMKNSPPCPRGYAAKATGIHVRIDARQLLFHRRFVINSLVLDHPSVNLISDSNGPWNFDNPHADSRESLSPGKIGNLE